MNSRTILKVVGALLTAILFSSVAAIAAPVGPLSAQTGGGTFAWGDNALGKLGDGTTTAHLTPDPTNAAALTAMAAGRHHIVGLETNGGVTVWGWNKYGQIGDGTKANRPTPVSIAGLTATAVGAGHYHSLALDTTGQVWAWGRNKFGQLGDGTTTDRLSPIAVPGATGVEEVEAGREHSMALLTNGTVLSWGTNTNGQLGVGDFAPRLTPTAIPALTGVDSLISGRVHSLALLDDGTVMAWGDNKYGQLGDGTTTDRSVPTAVPGLTGIVQLAAFGFHSVALDDTGRVWAWGLGSNGQIGDGTTKTNNKSPIQLASPVNVVVVGAGRNHSLAADSSGGIWGWGKNDLGQLGDGTTIDRPLPVMVDTIADTIALASGRDYTVALSSSITPPAPDTIAPEGFISTPTNNEFVNAPVSITGTATDNVGVASVGIAVKRLSDNTWLRTDGSFGGFQRQNTNLASPGAASTNWDISLALPDGVYRAYVTAFDTSGIKDPSAAQRKFTVISGAPDTTPPNAQISAPAGNSTTPSPVSFMGTATDDVGVGEVFVAIKRLSDGKWLRLDGSFGGYQRHPATLGSPGATSTSWDLTLTVPPAVYRMYTPAYDTSGNQDPTTAQRKFTAS